MVMVNFIFLGLSKLVGLGPPFNLRARHEGPPRVLRTQDGPQQS